MATKDLGYNSRPNNCTVASTSADIRTDDAPSFCYPYDNNCIRKCRAWNCANKAFYHTIGSWRSPDRVVALRSLLLLLSWNSRHTSQNIKKKQQARSSLCLFAFNRPFEALSTCSRKVDCWKKNGPAAASFEQLPRTSLSSNKTKRTDSVKKISTNQKDQLAISWPS